ncbi:Glutathione synthetase [Candidatus Arsenophonus lipoptenae]|uniref:Glutathione synthetase n=1 Tax=Candidatus Arsenophonus lipoptenae TaxID=634113 RepID=A0A0X9WA41_9GAMM|nr:glutathione synthase [Candidatus Arsenophonus lipoptenae]AMA64748.1 Glutathione synthetase [Candidatus Arsenophonus lipoptenae]
MKLGIVMDPIATIDFKKDSSIAMLLEAQQRGYEIYYMEIGDIYLLHGEAYGRNKRLIKIKQDVKQCYEFGSEQESPLRNFDVILMRKDPPFNLEYIYATYILEIAEYSGSLIINKPKSLRDCNEKLFTIWFANLIPDTLVTRNNKKIREFHQKHGDIILKPLDGMKGMSIFRLTKYDPNIGVAIEIITKYGQRFCMAQNYLSDIKYGDKRILIIDGEPFPYCLARIPSKGETRGNLAAGGYGEVRPLTISDWKIAIEVAPILKKKGLIFVGLDIIGDRLTEINVTSPTCIREIEIELSNMSITGMLFDAIEKMVYKVN